MQPRLTPAPSPGASWSSPSVSDDLRRRFLEEVATPGNLRRMFWFILACLPISLGVFIGNLLSLREPSLNPWSLFDLLLACLFLVLNLLARKKRPAFRHGHILVLAYYIYTLASMDGYYFTAFVRFGENTIYVLGVMMAAVLFRLPPRQFLTLLLTNHAVYVAFSLHYKESNHALLTTLVGGLDALVIACIAAWFLFAREWGDFLKQRVIEERNRELAAANALLRRNNEEMNEIMAIAAHDLRSPLHGMKSWFELLGEQEAWRREPYAEVITECGRACGGMLRLIARLLEAHTAETGSTPLLEKVAVSRLLEASLTKVERPGKLRNVRFETDFPEDNLTLETDPGMLGQAIDNLLDNALKFSPSGSKVEIAWARCGERCRIEIRDEGPGIAREEREKLFHKFHRGRHHPSGDVPGAGLGLFIVHQLVEQLGGNVTYHPHPVQGSVFRIELPLRREEG